MWEIRFKLTIKIPVQVHLRSFEFSLVAFEQVWNIVKFT